MISRIYSDKSSIYSYFNYIVFIKYLDIPDKLQEFEAKFQIGDSFKNWMKLIKLEIIVLVLAHVACCIFINIGFYERESGDLNWIDKYASESFTIGELYLTSLYFMIISVCTIGYGDITPSTVCKYNQ